MNDFIGGYKIKYFWRRKMLNHKLEVSQSDADNVNLVNNKDIMHDFFNSTFEEKMYFLKNYLIYHDIENWVEEHNVWARPLRPQSFKHIKFVDTSYRNKLNYAAFTMNRTLTALYEQDFLYLPAKSKDIVKELKTIYSQDLREIASQLIPILEVKTLSFIKNEVNVYGYWDKEKFVEYFTEKIKAQENLLPQSFLFIKQHADKKDLIKMLLIQHALDFLPESSHMARYIKGDFGELQSAVFRVIIDEFGYGRHETKHSTLFKKTLASVGLKDNSHAYWMFYLNSTLLNNNFFHMLTRSQEMFFQYIGAIAYAENTFGPYCRKVKTLLRDCYGDAVDVSYYKEHEHIDYHHGIMTLKEIIIPAIEKYGNTIIPDIIVGIEATAKLQDIAEEDFYAQIEWMSKRNEYLKLAQDIKKKVLDDIANISVMHLNEPCGELSVTHVHDGDEFCIVDEGVLRFCHGPDCFSDLRSGDCVVIKNKRLHGALVISDHCKYRIFSIGDYTKYADYKI